MSSSRVKQMIAVSFHFIEMSSSRGSMLQCSSCSPLTFRAQCYKTYYARNLRMLVISWSFCPWQGFQPSLMFVGEPSSQGLSWAPERHFTQVCSGLTHKHFTTLVKLAKGKQSSLLEEIRKITSIKRFITSAAGQPQWKCHLQMQIQVKSYYI